MKKRTLIHVLDFLHVDPAARQTRTILCVSDGPGATWRISFEIPLRRLRESGQVRLVALSEASSSPFDLLQQYQLAAEIFEEFSVDVVFVSRCNSSFSLKIIENARKNNIPVVYHLDDDLLGVPLELGISKYNTYNSPSMKSRIIDAIGHSDLLYCSTKNLAVRMARVSTETPIVHGNLYCSAATQFVPYDPKHPRTIGYMGTGGHRHDLQMILPALRLIMSNYADIEFELFGTLPLPPELIALFPHRVHARPGVPDYDLFLEETNRLRWSVALAPLQYIPFNTVKADTKFTEYTMAGMPVVASDGPVYRRIASQGAGLLATDNLSWILAVDRLLSDPNEAQAQVKRAQEKLRAEYNVEKLEVQLLRIIAMVSKGFDQQVKAA